MSKRTPLYETHIKLGARLVPFSGWDMPVQYTSITEEHNAVRNAVGIFDIGHMGVLEIVGADALVFIQQITTNDASRLENYQAQYSIACNEKGGTVDDLLVYKLPDKFIIIANASNTEKVLAWFEKQKKALKADIRITHATNLSMLSIQGPSAAALVEKLTHFNLSFYKKNRCFVWDGMLVSRTGYTGEDGFEIFTPADRTVEVWDKILVLGKEFQIKPCGLGARDTLRLEAALPLYGHEYDNETSPVEVGYAWAVKTHKENFIGKEALKKQKEEGTAKRLVGIELTDKGIPRSGYEIFSEEKLQNKIGHLTSGTLSPTLNKPIGLAYLTGNVGNSSVLYVNIRGRSVKGRLVPLPFYRRK